MKKITGISLVVVVLFATLFITAFQNPKNEPVRHIVVFKYKPDATSAQIEKVTKAFGDLQNKIPGIVAFEYGVNDSPENKNLGFTHVYQLTFEDAAARDNYLPHPEHKTFGELLGQLDILEDAFVVDYAPVKP
ncbi:Dabb family protein [Pontibacter harenae]|uniref:Dabb family protein n=1 Tax=Pontibacter harenae TaxID=2894083 RepID=UPI001E52326A|nr:Dabb family protein [Pontibacter harenae]MCC9165460.1 Dabb family protein [Pontibacter harenae]